MGTEGRTVREGSMILFEKLAYLFNCDLSNRKIIRMDFDEAALLYKYVKKCKSSVLEVGRLFGGSAILMASALGNKQKMYSIDMVDTEESKTNIGNIPVELKSRMNILTGLSVDIAKEWKERLSLIFLDGGHSYSALSDDVRAWSPFVEPEGYIVFHDIRGPGTYLGLEPIIQKMKGWTEVDSVNSTVVMQRNI